MPRPNRSYDAARRVFDVLFALPMLALTAPIFPLIAWLIRRESRGPAIFRQTRAGLHGKPFTVLKFRSMRMEGDPYGVSPHGHDDPRLTRIGRWLRETSLDELPQFWNVLRGDMTLIGPRPLYVSQIEEWTPRQRLRLLVRPGMTGLSQVRGRAAIPVEEKMEIDAQYVLNRSPLLDARILLATLAKVITRADIYEVRYSRAAEFRGTRSE